MRQSSFGSRTGPPRENQSQKAEIERYTKLDFVRGVVAATIHHYNAAPATERDNLAMRVRILQDQLASLRHRYPLHSNLSADLSWVDSWRPD
jgi:hypothetical protein